ncbi:hypothetical protein BYT27DRAFT_7204214, partial [Phlegmacium glaucopus]
MDSRRSMHQTYFTLHCSLFLISPLLIIHQLPLLITFSPSYLTHRLCDGVFTFLHCIFHAFYSFYNLPSLKRSPKDVRELAKIGSTQRND